MATTGDPWRTLGLAPGANLDEVRRAYRRLAKANHPDAAGEAALPRFLAIQAAYEQIAGPGRIRRQGGRTGGRGTDSENAREPREPWRADPERARASGRADGRRPGARPTGRPGPAEPGAGGPAGPSRTGAGPAPGASGRSRRSSGRRAPKTATPYSTSYDPADEEPFEPGWSGGTWYGASSGTYWTINPKEYADPRKHGPEYQARARRARGGDGLADDPAPADVPAADVPGADEPVDAATPPPRPGSGSRAARAPGSTRAGRSTTPSPAPTPGEQPRTAASTARPASASSASSARLSFGDPPFRNGPPSGSEPAATDTGFRGPLLPRATTPPGRLATALVGWPPLAIFAAAAIGESTGCGRYAASCAEVSSPGTWILAVAILLLLLAAPAVATWSAHGSIATLVVGVPSAIVLSAAGGSNVPGASSPILLGVLAVAYLAGVAYGLVVPRLAPSS